MYFYRSSQGVENGIGSIPRGETPKVRLNDDVYGLNNSSGYYSMQDQAARLQKMQQDINNISATGTKAEQALKKSIYYRNIASSVYNGITPEKKSAVIAAYNGLYEVYSSLPEVERETGLEMSNLRSLIIAQVNTAYDGSCYIYPWLYESNWANEKTLKSANEKYTDKRLAVHVFLEESYNSLPAEAQNKYRNERMLNLARTVDYFESSLSDSDKKEYINRLQNLLKIQEKTKTVTFISAYTQDVLSKYDTSIKSTTVKKNYKLAIDAIEAATKSPQDGIIFGKYIAYSMYAQYLYRINGNKVNQDVIDVYKKNINNVDSFIAQGLPEMNAVFKLYFANFSTEMGQWDQLRQREILISKEIPELEKFLREKAALK